MYRWSRTLQWKQASFSGPSNDLPYDLTDLEMSCLSCPAWRRHCLYRQKLEFMYRVGQKK